LLPTGGEVVEEEGVGKGQGGPHWFDVPRIRRRCSRSRSGSVTLHDKGFGVALKEERGDTMAGLDHFTRRSLVETDSSSGVERVLSGSAGSYWAASRCALSKQGKTEAGRAYFAVGNGVYGLLLEQSGREVKGDKFVVGKEDVVLPFQAPQPVKVSPLTAFAHRFEVQSVTCWGGEGESETEFVASVDSAGCLCVCEFRQEGGRASGTGGASAGATLCPERSYQAKPTSATTMEVGWSGKWPKQEARS